MPDASFWRGKRVLLTGHTGFKGSWLALWLRSLEADVVGYALPPPTDPSLYELAGVGSTLDSVEGDVRDYPALRGVIEGFSPEVVIHMAAQSVVRQGYEDPVETYSTNVMGTVHLFEALRSVGRPCAVVNVTSDKCYENHGWTWGYRESDSLGGADPYSNSKACAELVTAAFRESFFPSSKMVNGGILVASARAGNAVGGGDWTKDQLIPDLIRSFLEGKPCPIRNPSAVRPWQFVLEPLRGYLLIAEGLASGGSGFATSWNFGPAEADARRVSWLADRMVEEWGQGASWCPDQEEHPHEAAYLKLDASRAASLLAWRPLVGLDKAVQWIVEWYRGFAAGSDLRRLTEAQITRYSGL